MEILKNIFDQISIFDLIYLTITILYLIRCSMKGFVLSLLSAAKWLLAYILTLLMFPKVEEGSVFIIPSFCHHFVYPNETNKQRVVISFDLLPTRIVKNTRDLFIK